MHPLITSHFTMGLDKQMACDQVAYGTTWMFELFCALILPYELPVCRDKWHAYYCFLVPFSPVSCVLYNLYLLDLHLVSTCWSFYEMTYQY